MFFYKLQLFDDSKNLTSMSFIIEVVREAIVANSNQLDITEKDEKYLQALRNKKGNYESATKERDKKRKNYATALKKHKVSDATIVAIDRIEEEKNSFLKARDMNKVSEKMQERDKVLQEKGISYDNFKALSNLRNLSVRAQDAIDILGLNSNQIKFLKNTEGKNIRNFSAKRILELRNLRETQRMQARESKRKNVIQEVYTSEETFKKTLDQLAKDGSVNQIIVNVLNNDIKVEMSLEQRNSLLQIQELCEMAKGIKEARDAFFEIYHVGDDVTPAALQAYKDLYDRFEAYALLKNQLNTPVAIAKLPVEIQNEIMKVSENQSLESLLMQPIQRPMRYQNLFEEIAKNSVKTPQTLPTNTIPIQDFHKTIQQLNSKIDNAVNREIEHSEIDAHSTALNEFIAKWQPIVEKPRVITPATPVEPVASSTSTPQAPTTEPAISKVVAPKSVHSRIAEYENNREARGKTITGGYKMVQAFEKKIREERVKEVNDLRQKGLVTEAKAEKPKRP